MRLDGGGPFDITLNFVRHVIGVEALIDDAARELGWNKAAQLTSVPNTEVSIV
jgi:hypothetical protein